MRREDTAARALPRIKCLLVDDLEENLLALSQLLRRDDVEVLTARSGPEALELLLQHEVAVAFVDVQMPEMDGFELAELVRGTERTRETPLIFVTAGVRDPMRVFKGYESGAVDFLYKPVDPHVLRSKAEVFFQLYRHKLELRRELEERTEALRMNEMLVAVLSHDLRNPLSAILTGAQVVHDASRELVVREAGARMLSSGRRMSRMIEDLLDLTRARQAGGIPVSRVESDLAQLAHRALDEQRALHPGRAIDVHVQGDTRGAWDPERLTQVISNLLGNALQHGRRDEAVRVEVDGGEARRVSLTVENGGAIDGALLPSIFDPFRGSRLDSGRRGGLGLGLFIVREIVRAHGGEVAATSAEGRTRFRVWLPR
jgi:signal transduction histidine kinase